MRVALAVSLLVGCTDESVEYRACNDTGFAVTDLQFADQTADVLANGECTPYSTRESIGSSPPARLTIDNELYIHLPIDQTSRLHGRWSFHLTVEYGQTGNVNSVRVDPIED